MNFVALIWFLLALAVLVLVFGIRYLRNKENMALIERNIDISQTPKSSRFLLTFGIISISIALGFLFGMILSRFVDRENFKILTFLISILFCGGAGLIICSYVGTKKSNN
ncbi:DUF6249 domain-containing protein [Mucilaginibacter aquaedulcis]|uniref:DUF6249 domain-containing protein n=1 Tax=Mucilaginibacter aquaedulcis TaxID=1187081 RepID=UPI0025B40A76|nr:DUF6249 domain-containing protein [Mucilaginibacter aquaedulcis]MDN3548814.1 hypothetical protein [Mucilaginibacter aquaedulcis]